MKRLLPLLGFLLIAVTACGPKTAPPPDTTVPQSSSSVSSVVAQNVTLIGQVEEAGISIYQEGTHRLTLDDGGFVLLKSESIPLDDYIGKRVQIQGMEQPTVEAGGQIVTVDSIVAEADSSASSEGSDSGSLLSSSSSSSSVAQSSVAPIPASSSRSSVAPISSASAAVSSVASTSTGADALAARVKAMAKWAVNPATMSQTYCSSHAGFCFPVPAKAWWNSFGAVGGSLWRVEVSSEEILVQGDGPLSVNLVAGTVESKGAQDHDVKTADGVVTGYRSWSENRHFEVVAPAVLEPLVIYIVDNITVSNLP